MSGYNLDKVNAELGILVYRRINEVLDSIRADFEHAILQKSEIPRVIGITEGVGSYIAIELPLAKPEHHNEIESKLVEELGENSFKFYRMSSTSLDYKSMPYANMLKMATEVLSMNVSELNAAIDLLESERRSPNEVEAKRR